MVMTARVHGTKKRTARIEGDTTQLSVIFGMRRGHDWFLSEDIPDALFVFMSHGVLGV